MNNYIEKIPKNALIIANLVLLLFVLTIFSTAFWTKENKTVYSTDNMLVMNTASKLALECSRGDKEKCYKSGFKQLIDSYNFSFAEQTLYTLQDIDEGTKSCHILSHYISRETVKKSPKDWQDLLDKVNVSACGSGFLHGVLEAHLGDNPNTSFSGKLSDEVCNRGEDSYRKRMCTHFMGHFFIVNTLDNVDEAVPVCDDVVPELKFDCLNGLFMEHNQRIALNDHSLMPLPAYTPEYAKDLEKICQKYTGVPSKACWTEMAEVYAKTFGYDAKTIYNKCYKTANADDAQSCYFKGVVVLATYPYNVTQKKLTDICRVYSDESTYKSCTENLISSLMHYSPKFTSRGILLCSNINKYKEWCFNELGNQLSHFVLSADERLVLCSTAPENYKNLCAKK